MTYAIIIWGAVVIFLVSLGVWSFHYYFTHHANRALVWGWLASGLAFFPTLLLIIWFIIKNMN